MNPLKPIRNPHLKSTFNPLPSSLEPSPLRRCQAGRSLAACGSSVVSASKGGGARDSKGSEVIDEAWKRCR